MDVYAGNYEVETKFSDLETVEDSTFFLVKTEVFHYIIYTF